MNYKLVIAALQKHEDDWRRGGEPDYIRDAVMTALFEVRAAFSEAELKDYPQQLPDEPRAEGGPLQPEPPRDRHMPRDEPFNLDF